MITIKENGFHETKFHTKPKELKNPYYISDPELFKIYEKSLPPPEAYFYFPKGEEVIVINALKPENHYAEFLIMCQYMILNRNYL